MVDAEYANLVMNRFDEYLKTKSGPDLLLYLRYLDDSLLFWRGETQGLTKLIEDLNKQNNSIQFELEIMENNKLNFLDLQLEVKSDNTVGINLYSFIAFAYNISIGMISLLSR